MEKVLIEFDNVTKRFGDRTILDGVNLTIYDGHVTTIIGKSGTGKSVLLKHIMGLLSPTEGNILYRGTPIHEMTRKEMDGLRSEFSYCFQNNALFDSLTVFDNIALPLRQTTSMGKKEIESKVMDKVDQLELSEVPHKYPSELSGGMQKRVALARSLITDPKIVLFDEPTTGQDPIRKNAILGMIAHQQKTFGFTTIMISHEIPDVFFISDRILILYDGRIIFQGSYDQLDQLDHPMVDEFVKSLEGFQDELTGLHSQKSFEKLYERDVQDKGPHETFTVAIFILEGLDRLGERLGHTKAQELIHALGEYVNRHYGRLGIATRVGQGKIATILPNTDLNEAKGLLNDFVRELKDKGLGGIQAQDAAESEAACTFLVYAGLAEGAGSEDMDTVSQRAISTQEIIAGFEC